jgi:hypothetical protein
MSESRARQLGIQGLGWVIRRYIEPAEQVAVFYAPALQLQSFRPRGCRVLRPAPPSCPTCSASISRWRIRSRWWNSTVTSSAWCRSTRLESLGVPVVTVRRLAGGIITHAVDPEGHLFGFQQRTPDLLKPGEAERVEDALANRSWADGQ